MMVIHTQCYMASTSELRDFEERNHNTPLFSKFCGLHDHQVR